jgi:LL-diaminopimelate aminotransferase
VVGPGAAYGPSSDGYVRLSLTVPEERLREALDRIARVL